MDPQGIDLRYLTNTTRARIYLLWAILVPIGFIATHYHQEHSINILWTVISVIGLGYMYKVMPMRVNQMRRIFAAWLIPIVLGIILTGSAFYINTGDAANFIAHLGGFWLLVMGVGYILNGLVDAPALWYWIAAALNISAGIACLTIDALLPSQYLIAAIISAWSMFNLWIFRS
jgi:hypothetical protein